MSLVFNPVWKPQCGGPLMCSVEWKAAFATKKAAEDYQTKNNPSHVKPVWYCSKCSHWHFSKENKSDHKQQFTAMKEQLK